MTMRRLCATLLLVGVCLPGCQKQVELVFYNQNARPVDVVLTAPAPHGTRRLGAVEPQGTLRYTLAVHESELPAACSWRVDDGQAMSLVIREDTRSPQYLSIDDVFGHRGPSSQPTAGPPGQP